MSLIPVSMVTQLGLKLDRSDNNFNRTNASGEAMAVLGSTIVCLVPEHSKTRKVYCIVTDELREEEILLSYRDMLDWKLLSRNFLRVPKMKTPAAVKRVKLKVKRVKKITKKKIMKNKPGTDITPLSGGSVHCASAPSERGSGINGSSKKSNM